MKRRRIGRPQRAPLCAEVHEDDGIDPRIFFKTTERHDTRKTQQLCKQVFRTLTVILTGECKDAVLHEIEVESVVPAPDSSRLLVIVRLNSQQPGLTDAKVLERLRAAHSFLRQEVASAVCRKRAPDLVFQVAPREGCNHE